MEVLLDKGYIVEYWDVTKMFGIELGSCESFQPDKPLAILKINSYQEFDNRLAEYRDSFFISMMTCSINQAKMLWLLTKQRCQIAFWGPDPVYIPSKNLKNKISGVTLRKIKIKLGFELMKFLFKTRILHYYDFYFNVGTSGYTALGVVDDTLLKKTKAIDISSSDYSKYYYCNIENDIDGDYIVFIDQYFPFHPDFLICGVPTIPADVYYKSLNSSFKLIEEALNMRVIIAAHPKSLRYKDEDFFGGREVYMGATSSLVKGASLVLAHDSTAISYAIMSKKPIALLSSDSMKQYLPEHVVFMENFSKRFSTLIIDMDNTQVSTINKLSSLTEIQLKNYESYIYEYCTTPSISESNEQIVLHFIDELIRQ